MKFKHCAATVYPEPVEGSKSDTAKVNQAPEQEKILNKSSILPSASRGYFLNENLTGLSYEQLEDQMNASAVLLLGEMHRSADPIRRQELFEQAADQEASLISEVLDGAVKTDFRFDTVDGHLHLLQPNGVTDWAKMHEHGLLRAKAKAAKNAGYEPYVSIAAAELEESRLQEAMAAAGKKAVMVKLSLCGDDLMSAAQLKELGRNPEAQRAFLRVSVFDGQTMHIHSRSIDGMSLADGRDIATGWGLWEEPQTAMEPDASSAEILQNHLYFGEEQMDLQEMHLLADRLVGSFDRLQTRRTGRPHKAGRAPEGVDTYRFVLSNRDLLDAHLDSMAALAARTELPIGHLAAITNDLRYDIMSSFKQRLEGRWVEYGSLGESVARAGEVERVLGTDFGGCDILISRASTAEQAGYVNAQGPSRAERASLIKSLRREVTGSGACGACGAAGKLYGCGLCGACNKKWCDIFEKTGKQTKIKDLAKGKQGDESQLFGKTESWSQYWDRLGRETQMSRLKAESKLAESA